MLRLIDNLAIKLTNEGVITESARSEDFDSQLDGLLDSIDISAVCEPQAEEVS